jgi:hypothetical protein
MSHIDTLKVYEDLVESGVPETQAKAHVHSLDKSFDGVVTTESLSIALKGLEFDLKIFLGGEIGLLFLAAFLLPKAAKKWHWIS